MFLKKKEFWIGLVVSAVLLYFFLRGLNLSDNGETPGLISVFGKANFWWFIPSVALNLFSFVVRSWRWKYLLEHVKRIKTYPLFKANLIGFMINNTLPVRIGEFARAYVIGRSENIRKTTAFATIVVERVFDFIAVLAFLLWVLLFNIYAAQKGSQVLHIPIEIVYGSYVAVSTCLIMIIALLVLNKRSEWFLTKSEWYLSKLPERFAGKIMEIEKGFIGGINLFLDVRNTIMVLLHSLFMWLVFCMNVYCIFFAFHLPEFPFTGAMFVVVALALGVMVPSTPGGFGPFHAAGLLAIRIIYPGISKELAVSAVIMMHLVSYIPVTTIGVIYCFVENIKVKDLVEQIEEED